MTTTIAKIRKSDRQLVRVRPGGPEAVMQKRPLRPMTEEEIMAAALSDPDAQPLSDADFKRMKRVPRSKTLRRVLGLTQEEFALRYHIPIGTLRDWEQHRREPDQGARAYLAVIARNPEAVIEALKASPRRGQ